MLRNVMKENYKRTLFFNFSRIIHNLFIGVIYLQLFNNQEPILIAKLSSMQILFSSTVNNVSTRNTYIL